jgi:sterol desaturase/sphingolipid hydroxylase (fatty acid hydroxylase superfamily)
MSQGTRMDDEIKRFLFSLVVFAVISFWELLLPRRQLHFSKPLRWASNLGLILIDALTIKIIFPATAVGAAMFVQKQKWGLFNSMEISPFATVVLSVVLLDLVIYLQHMMFHRIPVLWKVHRMHHADLDFDVTTGIRFHPIEMVISMGIKFLAIGLLGAPPIAVLIFEILLNATSMFNHGNILLPKKLDRVFRWFIVTPDMHRIHHSIFPHETHSNFGFNMPWWDRLLGTYVDQPKEKHETMTIGLDLFRKKKYLYLHWLLALPFLSKNYPTSTD